MPQVSKGARKYADMDYLKALIDVSIKKYPDIPVAIHLDHGDTLDLDKQCSGDGVNSVMIDGSHHPDDESNAENSESAPYDETPISQTNNSSLTVTH